jgi:hypothetical protein
MVSKEQRWDLFHAGCFGIVTNLLKRKMNKIELLEQELDILRSQLKNHPLYQSIESIEDVQIFMENHVFAVWDFMSLLKALQKELTCVSVPWIPSENTKITRFINEIVHAEESDLNELGESKSHYHMYLDSMEQVGASSVLINQMVDRITKGENILTVLDSLDIPDAVREFVLHTFEVIETDESHLIASSFTFGREDIIPSMFIEVLKQADPNNIRYNKLKYYLDRHIELDGDEHGPISLEMMVELCQERSEKWQEAIVIAKISLTKRIKLWDSIHGQIITSKNSQVDLN